MLLSVRPASHRFSQPENTSSGLPRHILARKPTAQSQTSLNKQMSIPGRLTGQAHLKECPECAASQKNLSKDDDFIRQLYASTQIYEAFIKNKSTNKTTHHTV